jgi:hypothetical protein
MHVISPSHVPPNQDGQGKKVHGIIFVGTQEPVLIFEVKNNPILAGLLEAARSGFTNGVMAFWRNGA